jgi:hypothetical protein
MAKIATVEQALDVVKQDGLMLKNVPKQFKTPSVCLAAFKRSGNLGNYAEDVIDYIPKNLKELIEEVGKYSDSPEEELTDEEICLMAVQEGCTLSEVPEAYRTLDVCIEAIEQGNSPIEDVPEHLRAKVEEATDYEIMS